MLVQVDILYLRVELCSNVQVTIIRRHVSPYTLIFVNVIHWQWRDWQYWKVYDDIYLSLKLIQIWKNVSGYVLSSNVIPVIRMIKPCALMVKKKLYFRKLSHFDLFDPQESKLLEDFQASKGFSIVKEFKCRTNILYLDVLDLRILKPHNFSS